MEKEPVAIGNERRAWIFQACLVFFLIGLLVIGHFFDKRNALGIDNWMMRLSLIVVGVSIAADYINRTFGVFTGYNANMIGFLEQSILSISFGSITAFFTVAGTVLSGFADLIQ